MKSISPASTLLLGFAACGGSDLDPGSGDDPGSGTSTLQVNGSVRAEPRLTNARNNGEFNTEISVRIQLNGQDVTNGSVMMTSSSGTVVLAYDNDGRWRGNGGGYDEVYVLDIDSGNDNVHDVRVDGPSIHSFTEPQAGSVGSRPGPRGRAHHEWNGEARSGARFRTGEEGPARRPVP